MPLNDFYFSKSLMYRYPSYSLRIDSNDPQFAGRNANFQNTYFFFDFFLATLLFVVLTMISCFFCFPESTFSIAPTSVSSS